LAYVIEEDESKLEFVKSRWNLSGTVFLTSKVSFSHSIILILPLGKFLM